MANIVFILGAGASAPFGVPTLLRVFQDAQARTHLESDRPLREALVEHFWRPRGRTLDTSHLGLSVEEILTMVRDYEHQAYNLPPLLGDGSERFVRSLYVLIKKAIFDRKDTRGRYLNSFITVAQRRFQNRTWASFNWDCVFEASYYYESGPDYYSRHNPRVVVDLDNWHNRNVSDTFLKLHGGINWWYDNGRITYLPFARGGLLNPKWAEYERGAAAGQPVILEPSYYKYADRLYDLLRNQWDHFVRALLEADSVVVLGYSLPEADSEARRALTLGFQSNPRARWLVVDRQDWVCERYQRLFGDDRLQTLALDIADLRDDATAVLDLVAPADGPQ